MGNKVIKRRLAIILLFVTLISQLYSPNVVNAQTKDETTTETMAESVQEETEGSTVKESEADTSVKESEADTSAEEESEQTEDVSVTYDPQPTSMEEVQVWIDAFEAAYSDTLASSGFLAALAAMDAAKPNWQDMVSPELIPSGYNCQIVTGDTAFGADYYTIFVGAVAMSTSTVTSFAQLQTALTTATVDEIIISGTINVTAEIAVANRDLTIRGAASGGTLNMSNNTARFNLAGSAKTLTVDNLTITTPAGGGSTYGIFCVNNYGTVPSKNYWDFEFNDITFTGSSLVGMLQGEANRSALLMYVRNVRFSGANNLTVTGTCAYNAVVYAESVSISGTFTMKNGATTGTTSADPRNQYYFKSPGSSNSAASENPDYTNPFAYGTFQVEQDADVTITRDPSASAMLGYDGGSGDLNIYIRSLIYGYEKYIFEENSKFVAKAGTNRDNYNNAIGDSAASVINSSCWRSAVIRSTAATEFTVKEGATVNLTADRPNTTIAAERTGYTALFLGRSPSTTFKFTVAKGADLTVNADGAGAFARAQAPVMLMRSMSSDTVIDGTLTVNSKNGNGWYYAYNVLPAGQGTVGTDNFLVSDTGRVDITAATSSSTGEIEYAAFEHYNRNDLNLTITGGGVMNVTSNGYRAMSLAGGEAWDESLGKSPAEKVVTVTKGGTLNLKGVHWGLTAESGAHLTINVNEKGKMRVDNDANSTIYSVGQLTINVEGEGSTLDLVRTGINRGYAASYGVIFSDSPRKPTSINVKDGAKMYCYSGGNSHRAAICVQTESTIYNANPSRYSTYHQINVDGVGSRLDVINKGTTASGVANRIVEDNALYPLGAVAMACNSYGDINITNGADFYAESRNPISPTIALGGYSWASNYGLLTLDNPGEVDIRNDGATQEDIRGLALRGRSNYANYFSDAIHNTVGGGIWLANPGVGNGDALEYNRGTKLDIHKDTTGVLKVINSDVTVYKLNGGNEQYASYVNWADSTIIRNWKSANTVQDAYNVETSQMDTKGTNGIAASSYLSILGRAADSGTDEYDITLYDYSRIYVRGSGTSDITKESDDGAGTIAPLPGATFYIYANIGYMNSDGTETVKKQYYSYELLTWVDAEADATVFTTNDLGKFTYINTAGNTVTAKLDGLPADTTIYLKELTAPAGYELLTTDYSFMITSAEKAAGTGTSASPKVITVTNTPKQAGSITVTKEDSVDSAVKLNGAEFYLYYVDDNGTPTDITDDIKMYYISADETSGVITWTAASGSTIPTGAKVFTTDGTDSGKDLGQFTVEGLPYKTYYLEEKTAPSGYQLPSNPVTTVAVTGSAATTSSITNVKIDLLDFSFTKVNEDRTAALENAVFTLYKWTGETSDLGVNDLVPSDISGTKWSLVTTSTTTGTGLAEFKGLADGIYQMVETTAPNGYEKPSGQWRFTVVANAASDSYEIGTITAIAGADKVAPPALTAGKLSLPDSADYSLANKKLPSFIFTKVAAEDDKKLLKGAEFVLYVWNGGGEAPDVVDNDNRGDNKWKAVGIPQISDDDGIIKFEGLSQNAVYQLVETAAPTGYSRPLGQWRITVENSVVSEPVAKGSVTPPAFYKKNGSYYLPNIKDKFFPLTGFDGIGNYLLIGAVIMSISAAGVFFLFSRRKKVAIEASIKN